MENQSLPNLIIAGVNKAGTTSIFTYLSLHPEICVSRKKETCYFLPIRYGKKLAPLNEYKKYFAHCAGQKYTMESTPGYFYGGLTLARSIRETLGNIKILIVLRDPIDRLFSFYKAQKSRLILDGELTFREYVKHCECLGKEVVLEEHNKYWGITGGFYSNYIDSWFDTFDERHVMVHFFEDLKSDVRVFLKELCKWLGIDPNVYDTMDFGVENKSVNFKNRAVHTLALGFNKKFETFFRKYPTIKQALRHIYFNVNTLEFEETIKDEERAYLMKIYGE
jgi:hypothetical protein